MVAPADPSTKTLSSRLSAAIDLKSAFSSAAHALQAMPSGVWAMACAICGEVSRLALVNDSPAPTSCCLRCAAAPECTAPRSRTVLQLGNLAALERLAQQFQASLKERPPPGADSAAWGRQALHP